MGRCKTRATFAPPTFEDKGRSQAHSDGAEIRPLPEQSVSRAQERDCYLTEINFIDGQALTPSSFGETDAATGVWKPKKYAGTYGTNGFYLNFSDNSAATAAAIGKDNSGNGNNWTPNNISVTSGSTYDSMLDVPTMYADGGNGRGNYCVLNPLKVSNAAPVAYGNLRFLGVSGSFVESVYGTFGVTGSGKYYFEVTGAYIVGFNNSDVNAARDQTTGRATYHAGSGFISVGATTVQSGLATAYNNTDVVSVALDLDAGTIAFYKNNTQVGTNVSISAASTWWPFFQNTTTYYSQVNFGQRPFAYTPPSGFKALNTQNLPDATIKKGNQYFDISLYSATGSTPQTITNSGGFQPDLVWTKPRSSVGENALNDSARGASKLLITSSTAAEATDAQYITSFNSNGYSLGTNNWSGTTVVGWQWKAGGTAVSNTSGSITSSVSANTTAGFSVVTYTGTGASATIGHGLGVAPSMIIAKWRTGGSTQGWPVYHASTGASKYLVLNTTAAASTNAPTWVTAPTSSVFSVSTDNWNNGSGFTFVAYCFSEVAGFSKFGSYTGNGSSDGPFVYCGFRPRFVLVKGSSNSSSWQMFDTSRPGYNANDNTLWADLSSAEGTGTARIDLLSNGFKVRAPAGTDPNVSSATYIYMAFAENPTKYALAR